MDNRFRAMVATKYLRFERGLLSHEVEEALKLYLTSVNTQTQNTQASVNNRIPHIQNLKQQIRRYLVESGKYENEYMRNVHYNHLREAIGMIRGSDNRTVEKWLKLLVSFNCIRQVGGFQWEIL